jgi:murein DD-endopeptidase MepM/ murein hydrolase activator NlpD
VVALLAILSTTSLAFVAASGAALAQEVVPDTTTTTVPSPDTTTTTVPTSDTTPDTTTTTVPSTDTTTTVPTSDTTTTTTTTEPGAAADDHSPDDALAPLDAFVSLSSGERALVERLQDANETLAFGRYALVGLVREVAVAKEQLQAAVDAENAAVQRVILGLLGAALHVDDASAPAGGVHATSRVKQSVRTGSRAKSRVAVRDTRMTELDALTHRLESERKTAWRARVQAQDDFTALNARLTSQTQVVSDATAATTAAESAAANAFGADAVRARPDGITATLAGVQAGQPDPILLGGMELPIPGAALSSPFGIRIDPLGGGVGFHPGIDLEAGSGTQIHAAADGVVVMAGDCDGYGTCVVIDHGSSVATLYGHQSALLSQVGEHVVAGQVIGLVGATGKATGPHLHFEVRLHGIPVDPLPTFAS